MTLLLIVTLGWTILAVVAATGLSLLMQGARRVDLQRSVMSQPTVDVPAARAAGDNRHAPAPLSRV